jgi:hypothetical protein
MNHHEKLQGLAKFIVELSKQPGNEWLYDELFSLIEKNSNHNILNEHPKIRTVYNHCIEDVLKDYAEKSYANFQFPDLAEKLKLDFIKMETARQNGNLKLFILHCFQQAEEISNFIFTNAISEKWDSYKLQKSEISYRKSIVEIPTIERVIFPKYTNRKDEEVDELNNFKKNGWTISKKFEVVFYLLVASKKDEVVFFNGKMWFRKLNQLRNWAAHRGNITSEDLLRRIEKYQSNPLKDFSYFTNGLLNLVNPKNFES